MAGSQHAHGDGDGGGAIGGAAEIIAADPASAPAWSNDKQKALQRQLAELETLDVTRLRSEWRRLFRSEAPQLSRDLIVRALACRLQERVHGGLSKSMERQLAKLIGASQQSVDAAVQSPAPIRPGARLVREWRGRTHTVLVTERGFEYAGSLFTSLTTIAREITGARWSGPRFFGLRLARKAVNVSLSPVAPSRPAQDIGSGHYGRP